MAKKLIFSRSAKAEALKVVILLTRPRTDLSHDILPSSFLHIAHKYIVEQGVPTNSLILKIVKIELNSSSKYLLSFGLDC